MPRSRSLPLKDFEENDPLWWVRHHKDSLNYVCVRTKQLLKAMEDDNIDDIVTISMLLRVVLENLEKDGIGIYQDLPEEE